MDQRKSWRPGPRVWSALAGVLASALLYWSAPGGPRPVQAADHSETVDAPLERAPLSAVSNDALQGAVILRRPEGHGAEHQATAPRPGVLILTRHDASSALIAAAVQRLTTAGFVVTSLTVDPAPDGPLASSARTSAAALRAHPWTTEAVGVVGFGAASLTAHRLTMENTGVRGAVVFAGPAPALAAIPKVGASRAWMQIHLAAHHRRVNRTYRTYREAMGIAANPFRLHRYLNTRDGFYDPSSEGYAAHHAGMAWTRVIAFFDHHLTAQASTFPARYST